MRLLSRRLGGGLGGELLKSLSHSSGNGGLDSTLSVVDGDDSLLDSSSHLFGIVRNDDSSENETVGGVDGLDFVHHGDGIGELDSLG